MEYAAFATMNENSKTRCTSVGRPFEGNGEQAGSLRDREFKMLQHSSDYWNVMWDDTFAEVK